MKTLNLIVTSISLISASAALAGGGLVGSGNDGLISSSSTTSGSVTLPAPSPDQYGTLLIRGTAGAGQGQEFSVRRIRLDSQGMPLIFSGDEDITGKLNQILQLAEGYYLVNYQGTRPVQPIQVKQGTMQTVELSTIYAPPGDSKFKFTVYPDVQDQAEKDKVLFSVWTFKNNSNTKAQVCSITNPTFRPIYRESCAAFNSNDYRRLEGNIVVFTSDTIGKVGLYDGNGGHYYYDSSVSPEELKAGAFVSVFPGTYAVDVTDTETGKVTTTHGIKVE